MLSHLMKTIVEDIDKKFKKTKLSKKRECYNFIN